MISGEFLKGLAFFYANTNRWDLEKHGIIPEGKSGDTAWNRFNHNFDIFLLKLNDEQRGALANMAYVYMGRSASLPTNDSTGK